MTARKRVACVGGSVVALLFASRLMAAPPNCQWRATAPVDFGGYDVFSPTPDDAVGSVTLRCSGGPDDSTVTIDLSAGGSGSYTPRKMTRAGVETLDYNLFLDPARTQIWGNATGGTLHYGPAMLPKNTNVQVNIYGRIPTRQDKSAGNYTDTITATVNF
jgi:spore coat protein U-like protein